MRARLIRMRAKNVPGNAAAAANSAVGCLYLVGTPIGNLEDITLRALRILKEVDQIACEDTRHTQKLLSHYDIHKSLVSYHEHNELTRAPELVMALEQGAKIAGTQLMNRREDTTQLVRLGGECARVGRNLRFEAHAFGGVFHQSAAYRRKSRLLT